MSDQKYAPNLRLNTKGDPILKCTEDASNVKKAYKEKGRSSGHTILSPQDVHSRAIHSLHKNAHKDESAVLGAYQIQCGQYQGKSFKWILENDPGYVTYIACDRDPSRGSEICENVKFGAISWKFDILSITASLKLKFKNSFAHVWCI